MPTLKFIERLPKENNREYAYRLLRYNIMTLELEPGTPLNENEICEELSISRTPVHEAMTMLKSEYLVDIVPQSGSSVSLISLKNVREGLFLRSTIEPAIYRILGGNMPVASLKQMREIIAQVERKLESEESISIDDFIQLDDTLHRIAYEAAQKPLLWTAMKNVCSHYDRIRYQGTVFQVQDLTQIHQEHKALYEYLLLGGSPNFNLDEFYQNHLSYFKSFFPKLIEATPQYFTEE